MNHNCIFLVSIKYTIYRDCKQGKENAQTRKEKRKQAQLKTKGIHANDTTTYKFVMTKEKYTVRMK